MTRSTSVFAVMVSLATVALLAGCSGITVGPLPGGVPTGNAAGSVSSATSSHAGAASCTPAGTAIPDGDYRGVVKATITTKLTLSGDGVSVPNAGGGTEAWKGTIEVVSHDGTVTGTLTLSELGLSQVGVTGGTQVHSVDDGDLTATISGSATSPTVTGTGTGEWASLDAPVVNGSGSGTSKLSGGLHITQASCSSISGNAVAMFADFLSPVAQYLSVGGSGTWTASRR